jgi:hypothetical protein
MGVILHWFRDTDRLVTLSLVLTASTSVVGPTLLAMVKHMLSVTEWGRLPRNPSDDQLRRIARDTVYAAEMRMMDKAREHPHTHIDPIGYTLAIVLGTVLTCRDEPHEGVTPIRLEPLSEEDRAASEELWEGIKKMQEE